MIDILAHFGEKKKKKSRLSCVSPVITAIEDFPGLYTCMCIFIDIAIEFILIKHKPLFWHQEAKTWSLRFGIIYEYSEVEQGVEQGGSCIGFERLSTW